MKQWRKKCKEMKERNKERQYKRIEKSFKEMNNIEKFKAGKKKKVFPKTFS